MKKINIKILLIGVLGVGLLLVFWNYLNNYLKRSKASGDTVSISFSPKTGSTPTGQAKNIDILVTADGGKKISGVDVTLKGEGNIKITQVGTPVPFPDGDTSTFQQIIKTVTDQNARIAYVSSKPEADLPTTVRIPLTIMGGTAGTGKISIDQAKTQIVGTATGNVFTLGSVETLEFTFGDGGTTVTPPSTSSSSVVLQFDPSTIFANVGESFNTIFQIDQVVPAGKRISGFSTVIKYNPSLIEVTSVSDASEFPSGDTTKFVKLRKDINNNIGEIKLTYISQVPEVDLPTGAKVLIQAKGKSAGTGTLELTAVQVTGNIPENAYAPIIRNGTYTINQAGGTVTPPVMTCGWPGQGCCDNRVCLGQNLFCGTNDTCQAIDSPTPGQSGNATLNLKVKFQGILKSPPQQVNDWPVAIKLAGGALSSPVTQVGRFKSDENGVWSGTVSFNVPTGSGYRVYVKGPKHLQKKVCDNTPTETTPGTYRCPEGQITLHDGANELDFSRIVLLAGDLPEQGASGQNGVVDAFDVSFVRNNLGSTNSSTLAVGDLNNDLIIDSQDFSLILASLSVKYDEE